MKDNCEKYTTLITGLIDKELDGKQEISVKQHLDDCPQCHRKYLAEMGLKQLVQERSKAVTAPSYLKTRVANNLQRQGVRPGFWQLTKSMFTYRPAASSFALAFVLIALFLAVVRTDVTITSSGQSANTNVTVAELHGEIICLDCEYMQQRPSGILHANQNLSVHRLGIRTDNATVWTFLYSGDNPELVGNHELVHKKVTVAGVLFPESHFLQIKEYKLL